MQHSNNDDGFIGLDCDLEPFQGLPVTTCRATVPPILQVAMHCSLFAMMFAYSPGLRCLFAQQGSAC